MHPKTSLWETEYSCHNASTFFDSLLKDIHQAQSSVYLETYIFDKDALGEKFISALIAARKRGLIVKVLVDGIGTMDYIKPLLEIFNKNDIILKIYHPLPWDFAAYKNSVKRGSFLVKLIYFLISINKRNHRKLCIIDNKIAWIGSFNITSNHLPASAGGQGWKDHGLRVTGSNVAILAREFSLLWHRRRHHNLRKQLPFVLSTLNPIKRRLKARRITSAIALAKTRVWIANAYFAPHPSIVAALKKAASRGVDVRVLVGEKSDISFFPVFSRSFFADLIEGNIQVYEWSESVLHSKILLIDDYAYSGSSNLNSRSHYHDLELDIFVCKPETIHDFDSQFKLDFAKSNKIDASFLFKNRIYIFTMSFIPRILRYWL